MAGCFGEIQEVGEYGRDDQGEEEGEYSNKSKV